MRKVMFALAIVAGAFAVLAISDSADAVTPKCGSTWEICAQRGRGPGYPKPPRQPGSGQQQQHYYGK